MDTRPLSPSERRRLEELGSPLRRRQFVAGRVAARTALADATGLPPGSLSLSADPGRRPHVYGREDGIDFNIAHSGEAVAAVAGVNVRVGIDVETFGPHLPRLARRFCGLPLACRDPWEITKAWCRREATLKLGAATGPVHHLAFAFPSSRETPTCVVVAWCDTRSSP